MKLRAASLFVGISHVAALVYAAIFLRPGTPDGGDLIERASYVAANEAVWVAGWMAFVVAGGGLLWWMVLLRERLDPKRASAGMHMAVLLTAVGLALECVAHGLSSGLLPSLADRHELSAFASIERTVQIFGLVLGQAAFGTAILLAVVALRHAKAVSAAAIGAGFVNVAASAITIAAASANNLEIAPAATALVIGSLLALSVAVGLSPWAKPNG